MIFLGFCRRACLCVCVSVSLCFCVRVSVCVSACCAFGDIATPLSAQAGQFDRFSRRTDRLLGQFCDDAAAGRPSRAPSDALRLTVCLVCDDRYLALPRTDDAACFTCLSGGQLLQPCGQTTLTLLPPAPSLLPLGPASALPPTTGADPVAWRHCPLHLLVWADDGRDTGCAVCGHSGEAGPGPAGCSGALRHLPRPLPQLTLPGDPPSLDAPPTA